MADVMNIVFFSIITLALVVVFGAVLYAIVMAGVSGLRSLLGREPDLPSAEVPRVGQPGESGMAAMGSGAAIGSPTEPSLSASQETWERIQGLPPSATASSRLRLRSRRP
jgi:hypothetical protein